MKVFKGDKTKDLKSKTFQRKYCNLTLTPSIKFHWEVQAGAQPNDKEIEKHVELWFEKSGKALLGFDGSAFSDLHYKTWSAAGKSLKLDFEGSGKEGTKLEVEMTLASLKQGSGTAEVKGTFKTTTYEAGLADEGKIKLQINPQLKAHVDPNYVELAKWAAESPAGREAALHFGWVAAKAGAASAALKTLDLPVTLVVEVAKIDYSLYKENCDFADAKDSEGEVAHLTSQMWHGYIAGLRGGGKNGNSAYDYNWQKGTAQREEKIAELKKKHPEATHEACVASVNKAAAKIGMDKGKYDGLHKIAREYVWKRYYEKRGKKDNREALENHWLYIQGTNAASDSRFKAFVHDS
jgi:hypothetical protein